MTDSHVTVIASGVLWLHGWKWTGNFTTLDLIAAATHALNGALLARRPDHYKNFTIVGIILMALLMGLGGGITRDVLLGKLPPGAFLNPAYITVGLVAGVIGYSLAYDSGQLFREGLFQFMTSFSLPLYAIVGAQAAVKVGMPVAGVLAISVIAPTAGRWYVDVSSGVPPKQFIRGEWFVTIALLTGIIWVICFSAGLPVWASALIAFVVGYTVRVAALYYAWEEPLAKEPKGVYMHDDGRPMLGRKLKGKSKREMASLGLSLDEQSGSTGPST
ncbi:MAG: trimeric intracellular cation channel family protein [Streptosporangiaceae bacterium]